VLCTCERIFASMYLLSMCLFIPVCVKSLNTDICVCNYEQESSLLCTYSSCVMFRSVCYSLGVSLKLISQYYCTMMRSAFFEFSIYVSTTDINLNIVRLALAFSTVVDVPLEHYIAFTTVVD
jgi:hypothetical protein